MTQPNASKVASQYLKTAFGGDSLLDSVISHASIHKLVDAMEDAGDQQSVQLASDVYSALWKAATLKPNEMGALNRLRGSIERVGSWDAATQRNNIFKAADLLGLKLPSYMFASKTAVD